MRHRARGSTVKQIVSADGISAIEQGLPYPTVHYPGFYGAFFAFSVTPSAPATFCSCAKLAIKNYIALRLLPPQEARNTHPEKSFLLSSSVIPIQVAKDLMNRGIGEASAIIGALAFSDFLCHECNKATPSYAYCHSMYGSAFEQHYGWYINKQSLEYGVMPGSYKILAESCPDEIFADSALGKQEFIEAYGGLSDRDRIMIAGSSAFSKQTRRMRNIIENEVRVKFGFKKIGDAWVAETLLHQLVVEVLPKERVIRHFRAPWLNGLELDLFLPDRNMGIEYQGIQHFEPVEHWGGSAALKRNKARDRQKLKLCQKQDVRLIHFFYTEALTRQLVRQKLLG